MDAERFDVFGLLVQQQNEQILRLQHVMDERRQAIPLSVRPHHDYQELVSKVSNFCIKILQSSMKSLKLFSVAAIR